MATATPSKQAEEKKTRKKTNAGKNVNINAYTQSNWSRAK